MLMTSLRQMKEMQLLSDENKAMAKSLQEELKEKILKLEAVIKEVTN